MEFIKRRLIAIPVLAAMVFVLAGIRPAEAVPTLQLYSEGAEYITETESWLTLENPFELQVLGADQPNDVTHITDVQLHFAVPEEYWTTAGTITIEGEGIGPLTLTSGDFTLGTPGAFINNNDHPSKRHGIYPTYFYTLDLPDLLVDTAGETVYNYVELADGVPFSQIGSDTGDIQRYNIAYTEFFLIHMDLTGTAVFEDGDTSEKFAPFSHDADVQVPEPSTLLILGFALITMGAVWRFRSSTAAGRV